MKMKHKSFKVFATVLFAIALLFNASAVFAFLLPATTTSTNKLDAGYYQGGTILNIYVTGTISLVPEGTGVYYTNPDGSVVGVIIGNNLEYGNAGAAYPTTYGGDGINHYAGGGINYNISTGGPEGQFGIAGKQTTDTTDPDTIRFGSVVGTFSANPSRNDWFFVGYNKLVQVPDSGATLYLAVHDSYTSNNFGAYNVNISTLSVPIIIDIKPDTINPKSKGKIPVAILSTKGFNVVSQVDPNSLTFGRTGDEQSLAFCHAEDVNMDGLQDLICQFYTEDTAFQCGDTKGILKGKTKDNIPIQGSDSVKIVPCK